MGKFFEVNSSGDTMFYETDHCKIGVPQRPHVSREEGGHMVIFMKRKVSERYELSEEEAVDLMLTSMYLGQAMTEVLGEEGIVLRTINYQDNGNWAFLRGEDKTTLHLHLYGRAENTVNQTFGEALFFPDPNDEPEFYDRNEPLTDEDAERIIERFEEISSSKVDRVES